MAIKLTDVHFPGVVDLGKEISEAVEQKRADADKGGEISQDEMGRIIASSESIRALASDLKAKLDEVRGELGSAAVDLLMKKLPENALSALKNLQGDLPIQPGESALLVYHKKMDELMQMETRIHDARSTLYDGLGAWAWRNYQEASEGPHLNDRGQALRHLQGQSVDYLKKMSQDPLRSLTMVNAGENQWYVEKHNERLKEAWPQIPAKYLVKDPQGKGPGTLLVDQYLKMVCGTDGSTRSSRKTLTETSPSNLKWDLETLRAEWPAYVKLAKEAAQLKEHIRQQGLPSPEEVAVLKAQALSSDTPIAELHRELSALIAEIETFTLLGGIKREALKHESTTEGHSLSIGDSISRASQNGSPKGEVWSSSSEESYSTSHTEGTSEVLNFQARQYDVLVTPPFEKLSYAGIKDKNYVTGIEAQLLAERLLTARRLYEAMLVREPNSPFTRAVKGWMEESKFTFAEIHPGKNKWSHNEPVQVGSLHAANLRQDLLSFSLYPEDRRPLLREELKLGVPRPMGTLNITSLSQI
jgi:hypothetical protein